ncbi:MAG TPA: pyridoxamine 5'-phosphate oxidase [Actinomycetota bacterium]|nr:pyridoxamine 5'-phosphate oxidase [Actinomycetota bacterium]
MAGETARDRPLSRRDLHPDPVEQFRRWYREAEAAGVAAPDAMALATASADGAPSVRHVVLRGFDERGFVFYTDLGSRKARDLAENPRGAAVLYWRELARQVSLVGRAVPTDPDESEAYFRTRPREARLAAWASPQSAPIPDRAWLEARYAEADARFPGDDVPAPPSWGGYRIVPDAFEFWQGRAHRLHDRFRYERRADGSWRIERLGP